jgi:hypothetical protein
MINPDDDTVFNSNEFQMLMKMANDLANEFHIGSELDADDYLEHILINICNDLSNIVLKYDKERKEKETRLIAKSLKRYFQSINPPTTN